MKDEIKQLADEAWKIVLDPKSNRIEKIEALKLVAAARGILLPDLNESFLTVRQVCQLRAAKAELVKKVLKKKAARKVQNRKAYIRKQLREVEGQSAVPTGGSNV